MYLNAFFGKGGGMAQGGVLENFAYFQIPMLTGMQ